MNSMEELIEFLEKDFARFKEIPELDTTAKGEPVDGPTYTLNIDRETSNFRVWLKIKDDHYTFKGSPKQILERIRAVFLLDHKTD